MQKTVKVRVAVAVDPSGRWSAFGQPKLADKVAMHEAAENLNTGVAYYWLTAELPIPEPRDVAATVEKN